MPFFSDNFVTPGKLFKILKSKWSCINDKDSNFHIKIQNQDCIKCSANSEAFVDTQRVFKALCAIVSLNAISWLIIPLFDFVVLMANFSLVEEKVWTFMVVISINQLASSLMPLTLFLLRY